MTEWRPIQDFPGYEVSRDGAVRGKSGQLKLKTDRKGYRFAVFRTGDQCAKRAVARLVAEAFIGPRPAGQVVRHRDGSRDNNQADNLVYGTSSQNELDKREHGTAPIGTNHPAAKLTEQQVAAIRKRYVAYDPHHGAAAMARELGVSTSLVSRIIRGKLWAHTSTHGASS